LNFEYLAQKIDGHSELVDKVFLKAILNFFVNKSLIYTHSFCRLCLCFSYISVINQSQPTNIAATQTCLARSKTIIIPAIIPAIIATIIAGIIVALMDLLAQFGLEWLFIALMVEHDLV